MCTRVRRQKMSTASNLLVAFREYQTNQTNPSLQANRTPSFNIHQEPQSQGIAYREPEFVEREPIIPEPEPISRNPPSYEEVAGVGSSSGLHPIDIPDEKPSKFKLVTTPSNSYPDSYEPNTGLNAPYTTSRGSISSSSSNSTHDHEQEAPRVAPVQSQPRNPWEPHRELYNRLVSALTMYYDTHIQLSQHSVRQRQYWEKRKGKKLAKADRKYHEKVARGRDDRYGRRMERRAAKYERWTEMVITRNLPYDEYCREQGWGDDWASERHVTRV
ncbi:hypothetical protein ABW19_dt0200227 [Dactylella cylindrospora]|nr:hypothetical protein ABW19_dt0200227 [Dactylella cylindrospora]